MKNLKKTYKYNFKKEDLSKFIEIIKTGSKSEIKEAKKQMEYFWNNFYINNRKEGEEAFEQFLDEIKHFDDICDIEHQAHFINALKWAIWTIGDKYFEHWVEFILKCMEYPSGKIRQQTIHTASILSIVLNLPKPQSIIKDKNTQDPMLKYNQTLDLIKFGLYVYTTEKLIKKYFQPKFKKYKYVSSLPVSQYKSLQKLITEEILRSEYYNINYQWFLTFFENRLKRVYSGKYSLDLKLLLTLIDTTDSEVINYISKN